MKQNRLIQKGVIFVGTLALIVLLYFVFEFCWSYFAKTEPNLNSSLLLALFATATGLAFHDRLERFFIRNVVRRFLDSPYDEIQLLKEASRGMSKIESLHRLFGLVVHFITMRVGVENAAILKKDDDHDQFILEYQRGYQKKFLSLGFSENHPLIEYLSHQKEAVEIQRPCTLIRRDRHRHEGLRLRGVTDRGRLHDPIEQGVRRLDRRHVRDIWGRPRDWRSGDCRATRTRGRWCRPAWPHHL